MASALKGKRIVLGVSGGIAAYKSAELLRLMVRQEARVRVVMTSNAGWFVGAVTFQALSGQPVCSTLFDPGGDASIRHIDWAQSADAVVVAPATANIVGKLANGIADDALSTFLTAVTCPLMICPAMNTRMLNSAAVRRNIERLRADGVCVIDPDSGEMACKTTGVGRLPEPAFILDRLAALLTPKDFAGRTVLITAGPTREPIDPVRFISNPSSGKMGYAVARAAERRGACVVLISGPVHLAPPANVELIRVDTAEQMASAVFERFDGCDILIKTAAVSDYRPKDPSAAKIKKGNAQQTLVLVQTPDILREIGLRKGNRFLVGFAAETESLVQNAGKKLAEKNLDMIVGNLIGPPDSGFAADTNQVTFFYRSGPPEPLPVMEKEDVARLLLDRIAERWGAGGASCPSRENAAGSGNPPAPAGRQKTRISPGKRRVPPRRSRSDPRPE